MLKSVSSIQFVYALHAVHAVHVLFVSTCVSSCVYPPVCVQAA